MTASSPVPSPTSPTVIYDKTPVIASFLLPLLEAHKSSISNPSTPSKPFFLGISGLQGSGKTSLCTHLSRTLTHPSNHNNFNPLRILTLSIDDLYHPYDVLTALSSAYPENPFLRQRGNPGTHDIALGEALFRGLDDAQVSGEPVKIPSYDKSRHAGKGDRVDVKDWRQERPPWDVVIFEGWCVGFWKLPGEEVERRWRAAGENNPVGGRGKLGECRLEDALWVNEQLGLYEGLWGRLNALVHIDAEHLSYVYDWRLEQEHTLISEKGTGMTDEQVKAFVDAYMPAYELYLDGLREALWKRCQSGAEHRDKKQLRIVIGKDRNAVNVVTL